MYYLQDALLRDPLTALLLVAGAGVASLRGTAPLRALAVGLVAYLAYIVWIGGDFMSMRFFAAPAVLAAALLATAAPPLAPRAVALLGAATLAVGLLSPGSLWLDDGHYADNWTMPQRLRSHGIADERAFYAPRTRALHVLQHWDDIARKGLPIPPFSRAVEGAEVHQRGFRNAEAEQVGYFAYFAGPDVVVLDRMALTDPVLARIPFVPHGRWRVGHYQRVIPPGYTPLAAGAPSPTGDPAVDAAFEDVFLVVCGPLWSVRRWEAIWALNTGVHHAAFNSLASGVEAE